MGFVRAASAGVWLLLMTPSALAQEPPAPGPPPALPPAGMAQPAAAPAPSPAPVAVPAAAAAPTQAPGAVPAPAAPPPGAQAAGGQWMLTPEGRYTWIPAGYELPPVLPYKEGQPIPSGYHLEERPRRGAVITGYLLTGIPYAMGLMGAFSSDFTNESKFLALPWAGPWLTLGFRESKCKSSDEETSDALGCASDALVVTALFIDGILQAVGGALLLTGYIATKQELVRDGIEVSIVPGSVGRGQGLMAIGAF